MLHEVLLALSGHPSPLFNNSETGPNSQSKAPEPIPLLSPSEAALLQSIGELSELHCKLRHRIKLIAARHNSIIARAVGTSIQQLHLARFQKKILDVECSILTKDASTVGAYDIVPLAGIVGEFDEWHRRMGWYWEMACFVQPPKGHECSGSALIDKLRADSHTGFADIADAAVELSIVAEMAWLRQLTSWLLYGRVPAYGAQDFFIQPSGGSSGDDVQIFRKDRGLLPAFMTPPAASAALFVGKSLHQIRHHGQQAKAGSNPRSVAASDTELVSKHLELLSSLSLPIVPAQLSRAISAIRLSLSQNVLQQLLPMTTTLRLLSCLRQFFLLSRGEFGGNLIIEAENRRHARQQSMGRLLQQNPVKAIEGLNIKDAELHQTLTQTWKTLAREDEDGIDNVLDFARAHILLSVPTPSSSRPTSSDSVNGASSQMSPIQFNNLLFPTPAQLHLSISPPLDLILSERDMETYAAVNAYLLSIERADLRLSNLWRRSTSRREISSSNQDKDVFADNRARGLKRTQAMRKVWATCSSAIFLISETAAYFEGEIVKGSCDHFESWVKKPVASQTIVNMQTTSTTTTTALSQRDPETLASGHRAFLASLVYALLLTDIPYTRELRSLLGNVDSLIAFFTRLFDIQEKLDIEHQSSGENSLTIEDERATSLELDRARKKVDSDLRSVVSRLRQLDQERIGSARYLDVGGVAGESGEFEAWKGGGLDRLLMKVEFGRVIEGGSDTG